ncbi:ABC transporter ATP-binding protein [Ornithinimicrobium cryptoxanthini]|uniref:ABC transporter ATP-binding protein n=1 Tax=Ornithinimicrobium cryptoxanthini TaxID=2934161 RepID=UPI0021179FC9|nr:ABC transporter ATP-binding protein [Ornithinimicrobium cryptoxanthini]
MSWSAPVKESELRADVRTLRVLFRLVPWRMRRRVVLLAVASALVSVLDIVAVATMLPLTQMLTSSGELPSLVEDYLVPVVGTSDRQSLLLILALIVGGAFAVKNVLTIMLRWWSIGVTQEASSAAQSAMLRRYVGSSYVSHRRRSKATVLQVVSSAVPASFGSVLLGYISILVDGLTVLMLFATLIVLAPLPSLVAVVIFGGTALLIARVLKPWAIRVALRSLDLNTRSWAFINPAIEGFRETRIFRKEELFARRFEENRAEIAGLNRSATILGELPKYLLEIVMIVGIFLVAVMLFAMHPEDVAFGYLAVFAAAAMRIIPALNRLVATYNGVRNGRVSLRLVVNEVAALDADTERRRGVREEMVPIPAADDIVVSDLSFRFPDSTVDVLHDVDVTIPRGSTVALVGSSGAGKTTFADILTGLFEPTSGSVTVGGVDITDHPCSWLAEVAVVSQRVYVWEATLRDLITFGDPIDAVDAEHLGDVIRRSRLQNVVASLPDGLDTIIGESGSRLSGGQIQRVGIARALYAKPSVLILDEATSALDNETEHEITETIWDLHGEITVIVIAHRLSTVQHADEILFFSGGRLKSRGTMAQLRESEPEFARLVELGSLKLD